jgi:Dolichyl-phosphate-mannose-protein mannosyltransferase
MTQFPPYLCTSIALAATAILTLLFALRSNRGEVRRILPAVTFVFAGAAMFWRLSTVWWYLGLAVSTVSLCLHYSFRRHREIEPQSADGATRLVRGYLVVVLLFAVVFTSHDLGSYAGTLLPWEASTVRGFAEAFADGESVADFTASRLLWQPGVLSQGDDSLFYGAPTYLLLREVECSTRSLRAVSVVCALLSLLVVFALCRRFFGDIVAVAVTATVASNPAFLVYARYASSPAATIFATTLALYCTWLFLDDDRSAWWMGGVAGVALYLATLQYASGRIVVLILLSFVPFVSLLNWRRLWWRRAVGLALLVAAVIGVWHVQGMYRRRDDLLAVRGEQFFRFSEKPETYEKMLGQSLDRRPDWQMKLRLARELLRRNTQQYGKVMLPAVEPNLRAGWPLVDVRAEFLTPYYAPLVLFLLLGMGHSLARIRRWPHTCLFYYLIVSSGALLLTSHVDGHRASILIVPISIWIGLGVWEIISVLRTARVPRTLQHVLAAVLALTIAYNLLCFLYDPVVRVPTRERAVLREIEKIHRSVMLGYDDWQMEDVAWVELGMLERSRLQPSWKGTLLPPRFLEPIRDRAPVLSQETLDGLQTAVKDAVLLLGPATAFRRVATKLAERGAHITEIGPADFPLLRIEVAAEIEPRQSGR